MITESKSKSYCHYHILHISDTDRELLIIFGCKRNVFCDQIVGAVKNKIKKHNILIGGFDRF